MEFSKEEQNKHANEITGALTDFLNFKINSIKSSCQYKHALSICIAENVMVNVIKTTEPRLNIPAEEMIELIMHHIKTKYDTAIHPDKVKEHVE